MDCSFAIVVVGLGDVVVGCRWAMGGGEGKASSGSRRDNLKIGQLGGGAWTKIRNLCGHVGVEGSDDFLCASLSISLDFDLGF